MLIKIYFDSSKLTTGTGVLCRARDVPSIVTLSDFRGTHLVVLPRSLAPRIQQARPILGLKAILQVAVDKHLDVVALGAHRKGGYLLGRGQAAQNKRSQDGREGAPITHNVTLKTCSLGLLELEEQAEWCV